MGMKERGMAIFIGIIMITSIIGFAMINSMPVNTNVKEIPYILDSPASTEDVVYILRTGRVLIRFWYNNSCADCGEKVSTLERFVNNQKKYAVLERVLIADNETTRSEMIGAGGEVVELKEINDEALLDTFCKIAMLQPKECLLREI